MATWAGVVYGLVDPRAPRLVRYVGKTTRAPEARLADHRRGNTSRSHLGAWLRKLAREGVQPDMRLLVRASTPEYLAVDEEVMRRSYPAGQLVNGAPGGFGGSLPGHTESVEGRARRLAGLRNMSVESRARISAAWKGKKRGPQSAEHRAKVRANNYARRPAPWNKGKPMSEAQKEKISVSRTGKGTGPMLNRQGKGHPQSAETRAKISKTRRRLGLSWPTRKNR